jgi:hypothetical protein
MTLGMRGTEWRTLWGQFYDRRMAALAQRQLELLQVDHDLAELAVNRNGTS